MGSDPFEDVAEVHVADFTDEALIAEWQDVSKQIDALECAGAVGEDYEGLLDLYDRRDRLEVMMRSQSVEVPTVAVEDEKPKVPAGKHRAKPRRIWRRET